MLRLRRRALRNSAFSSTPQATSALVMSFMESGGENIRVVTMRSR